MDSLWKQTKSFNHRDLGSAVSFAQAMQIMAYAKRAQEEIGKWATVEMMSKYLDKPKSTIVKKCQAGDIRAFKKNGAWMVNIESAKHFFNMLGRL